MRDFCHVAKQLIFPNLRKTKFKILQPSMFCGVNDGWIDIYQKSYLRIIIWFSWEKLSIF
jgi:hypothetical protein